MRTPKGGSQPSQLLLFSSATASSSSTSQRTPPSAFTTIGMTCWHPLMSSCSSSPPCNLLHRLPVPRFHPIRRLRRRRLPLFFSEFFFPFIILLCCWLPMATAEKTLCERKLAQVPPNVFYYQRTEAAAGTVECAERCVEDWEFCRSALLVQQKGKSLCQLYGVSFERQLPLTLPQLTPAQADPERLLPITLIELADPPCSSKFSANSQLMAQLSPGARDALAMMPRPSATKKFQPPQLEQLEDATVLGGPKKGGGNDLEEGLGGFGQDDKTYLTDFPPSKGAADTKSASSAAAGASSGFAMDTFSPMPIRPSFVSHGIEHPGGGGTWRSRCRNGFCGPRGQTSSATSPNRGLLPCAARKTTDPCAPQPQWLEWTPGSCSVSCGNGTRERRRYCSSGKQTDCAGEDTEPERCVMPSCDQWTDWTEWSRCSVSCGGGQRTRERVCRTGDRCTGPASDSRSCNDQFCPQWAEWADWGQCSASCGRGSQRRVRECMPKEAECGGLSTEHRQCELRPCPSWGDWEPWSSCSKTCGGGEAIRRRECQNGVADDCRGPAVEHLLCNTQPCPAWSSWTDWGACSKSCGEGSTKLRQRECRYGGLPSEDCAGPAQDETQCRLAECPAWTEWTLWSDCSTTCGHGRQTRSRQCRPNGFGCQGGDREVRFCQKAVCPYFDNWTEWGGCSVTCGQGFCERRRNCIRDADLGRNGAATASSADGDDREVPSGGSGGSRTEAKGGRGRNKEKEAEEEEDKEDAEAAENESEPSRSRNGWSASGGAGRSLPEDITAAADSLSAQTLQVAQSAATVAVDRRRSPLISSKLTLLRDNNTGGGDCMGPDVERKPCDAGPCCVWAAWSPWSNCRVRCGNSGNRERTRRCQLEQANNNDCGSTTAAEGGPCNYNQQQQQQSGRFSGNFGGFAPHNPFNGLADQQCSICIGESRQSETCAIPDPGRLCDEEKSERPRDLRARPKLREEVESAQSHQPMREQQQPPVLDDDDRIKVAGIIDEEQEKEDCYWTEWSEWSVCDPKTLLRNRTRMCAGLRALADNCQCQGPILEQIACPVPMMMPMPMPDNLRTSSSSLIKRVQLIPRHKPSRAEKEREEQRKSGKEPQTTVDQLVKREQPMAPESAAKAEECADWLEWSPWTQCLGPCGREGLRSRTRECQCQRGCAGISRETVSCQTMDC